MTRKARIWLVTALVLAVWLGLAWVLPSWLALSGPLQWAVRGMLAAIGTFVATFVATFLTKRPPPPPAPKDPLSQEMEAALLQSERRLVESRLVRSRPLQRLPGLLLLGARTQQKTSTVLRSGSRAELLAGDVLRNAQVVPTQALNVWLSTPALIVEPSVDVLADRERRARLWHRLQPAQLADAVTRGEQAPRAVLVCQELVTFRTPGAGSAVARELRVTLAEIAQVYGIRLPVYVLFTASDKVTGFKEYAKHLSNEEVREVVGATLAVPLDLAPSTYAEAASRRMRDALGGITRSLAERRHLILTRLPDQRERAAAYQFPRELRKLESELAEFLVELVRPSELQVNPFVRGFYFTGVRDIVVAEGAAPAAEIRADLPESEGGATALLISLPRPGAGTAGRGLPGVPTARREPQWVFLERLFSGVVLNDPVAFAVTRGGTRISYFRRLALGAVLGVAALLLVAVTVSFGRNLGLARRFEARRAASAAIPAEAVSVPTLQHLALLDSLGASLDEISDHAYDGAPFWNRWGLSRSARLYPTVRAAWLRPFGALLFASTQQRIVGQMKALNAGPLTGRDYDATYRRLKAHLITAQYPDSSSVEFLAPALLADWPGAATGDTVLTPIVQRQFERFARELRRGARYGGSPDAQAVQMARAALHASAGDQPIYQALIADASTRAPEFRFSSKQMVAVRTLSVPQPVPGAFTAVGFNMVEEGFRHIDRYLKRETWVVGPEAPPLQMSSDSLVRLLRARYDAEYVEQWRGLMRSANVVGFSSLSDAAIRLNSLGSNSSELLILLAVVNENIPADSQRVAKWFTTVRSIGARTMGSVLTTEATEPYRRSLTNLAAKTQLAAGVTDKAAGRPTFSDALLATSEVSTHVQGIAAKLDRNELETLGLPRLLEQPARHAAAVLQRAVNEATVAEGAAGAEAAGAQYCAKLSPLTSKRPFVASGDEVSPQDLAEVFGPNSPLRSLTQAIRETGSPEARQFLARLNRFAEAIYGSESNEAQLRFEIAPDGSDQARTISLAFGGRSRSWGPGESEFLPVTWNVSVDRNVVIGVSGLNNTTIEGTWAVKNFFQSASGWTSDGPGVWRFREGDRGLPLRARMSSSVQAVLRGEIFSGGVRCPSKWTR